ncbi:hypothetical protein RDI58_001251 [Solanum bulbocastanum]|uniref:Uncharacterized protein n=1 Tax=Solanum bulbocastanum TaxID=147425 RepID=A0AAN8U2G4_SOLBU
MTSYSSICDYEEGNVNDSSDGQTSVENNVHQGEREFVQDNKSIGRFCLDGSLPELK